MPNFRLKKRAKAYQKIHGGRITGTTGAYKVVKNAGRKRRRRNTPKLIRKVEKTFLPNKRRSKRKSNSLLNVDAVGGWIKARAVKVVKVGGKATKLLIKR